MMSLRFVFVLFVCLHVSPVISAQTSTQQDVQKVIRNLFEGFSALNAKLILDECTSDVVILEDGVIWTRDSIMAWENNVKGQPVKRENTFEFHKTEVTDSMAWVYYDNKATFSRNDKSRTVRWLESAVLVKRNGGWKVRMLHSTRLP
jgi:hypothetical protein